VVCSKQYGNEEILSRLIAEACVYSMPTNTKNFNVDNIRVSKILGGSINESKVIHGMVVLRNSETSVHEVKNAKVAVFGTPLEMNQGETKGTVIFKNADDLLNYTKSEEDKFEEFVKGLADAGINVIIGGGSISEVALHFFEKYKILTLKILSKFEVKRIAKSVGAATLVKLGTPTPEEIGFADIVEVTEISSTRCTVFRRDDERNRMSTIVLRGSTSSMLDDAERAVDDGVSTVKSLVRDQRLCAGAGATEIHLAS